jgi:Flp pilus assembly protein protease CpaA
MRVSNRVAVVLAVAVAPVVQVGSVELAAQVVPEELAAPAA